MLWPKDWASRSAIQDFWNDDVWLLSALYDPKSSSLRTLFLGNPAMFAGRLVGRVLSWLEQSRCKAIHIKQRENNPHPLRT
jgi:hypothetical protein